MSPVSRAWSWRHAVLRSGLPATTRHVLLTLSVFMDGTGRSCFPKIEDLVKATALSKKSVITHLGKAVEAGWLRKQLHGYKGQRWRQLEYESCWPGRETDDPHDPETEGEQEINGGEPGTPPQSARVQRIHTVGQTG